MDQLPSSAVREKSLIDVRALAWNLVPSFVMVLLFAYGPRDATAIWKVGLHPRSLEFWYTAFTSAFIHGDSGHLFSNLTTQLLFGYLLLSQYGKWGRTAYWLSWPLTGIVMWIFTREVIHIGFSGVLYAWMLFMVSVGLLVNRRSLRVLILLIVTFYGAMFWGLFPIQTAVSWDGHLSGAAVGIVLAFIFRRKISKDLPMPAPPEWDDDEDDEDEYLRFGVNVKE